VSMAWPARGTADPTLLPAVESAATETPAHRLATWAVAVSIIGVPLLLPSGPANSAPTDVLIVGALLGALLWATADRVRVRAPFIVSVGLFATFGLVSALLGRWTSYGGMLVISDLYLYVWCLAIVNVMRTPGTMRTVLRAWSLSAAAWASVLVFGALSGQSALAGLSFGGTRAALTFSHPNQAGSYFLLSFWVVLATPFSTAFRKAIAAGLVLAAMLFTGSMGALTGFAAGVLVVTVAEAWRRRGAFAAVAVPIALACSAGTLVWAAQQGDILARAQESDVRLIHDSIGRSDRSSSGRLIRFSELWSERAGISPLGIGPGATKMYLEEHQATEAKEAHSDYVATLVERGIPGALALVLLLGTIAVQSTSLVSHRIKETFRSSVAWTVPLAAAAAGLAVNGLTHEVLHYRQSWGFIGVLGAVYVFASDRHRRVEVGT
jgi:O-Antigen ligase